MLHFLIGARTACDTTSRFVRDKDTCYDMTTRIRKVVRSGAILIALESLALGIWWYWPQINEALNLDGTGASSRCMSGAVSMTASELPDGACAQYN